MDKLPEEILLRIFTYSNPLRQLVRVSREFYRIAKPLLYSECRFRRPTRSIRRMLNTLVTVPDARSLIRCLEVGIYEVQDAKDASVAAISIADLSDIVQSINNLASYPLEYQRQLGRDLLNPSRDAMVAAILHLLPNLDALTLRRSPAGRKRNFRSRRVRIDFSPLDLTQTLTLKLIELSMTPSLAAFSLFSHLSYACINDSRFDGDEFPRWNSSLICVFLRLPALKTFEGIGCREADGDNTWFCGDSASAVTKIHLDNCQIGADAIRKILRSCRALEDFACSRVCESCLDEESTLCDYSYENIHDDLIRHQKSLHTLRLDSQSCSHISSRSEYPVTTLATLDNLKFLEIDDDVLFGFYDADGEDSRSLAEIFPTSLQNITLSGELDGCGIFRGIRRVLLSHKTITSVTFDSAYLPDAEKMLEELSEIALELIGDREPHGYCDFRIYKAESNQTEGSCGDESWK